MLTRKQIFDAITDDGKRDMAGKEAQRIIDRLMDLQSQNLQQTDVSSSALAVATSLAQWSRKYPRGRVYSFHQKNMDDELIEIEEAAKRFIDG